MSARLLLVDIDGVLVFEADPPFLADKEVLRLHDNLAARLQGLHIPFIILTHRSRREALHILAQLGLTDMRSNDIIAAEDLFFAALRAGRFRALFGQGLAKSLIFPTIYRRLGIAPADIAFIDDKRSNLLDLASRGLGWAFLAPSSVNADAGTIETFALDEFLSCLESLPERGALVELVPIHLPIADWQRTGINTHDHGRHWFNTGRRIGRSARLLLRRGLERRHG